MKKLLLASITLSVLAGCAANGGAGYGGVGANKTVLGTGIGAATGAGLGALIAKDSGKGALIGAAAGAALGAGAGYYLDRQEKQLRAGLEGTGVEVQRTPDNTLKLTMPSSITFATNSATLTPNASNALSTVSQVLNQYPESNLNIVGHTDSQGSNTYNQQLSEHRAQSVAGYLITQGVNAGRLAPSGMGELQPVADNNSEVGRAQNRRVELIIRPNANAGQATPQQNVPPATQQPGYYPVGQ